jgi:hypothetical protein
MGSLEQLIRIGLLTAGGAIFGSGVAESAEYQAGVGAAIQLGTFAWWLYRNSKSKVVPKEATVRLPKESGR